MNPADVSLRNGSLAEYMSGLPPYVAGLEAAGIVDAVGPGATWQVGDEVVVHTSWMPDGHGAHTELIVVHSDQAGPVPRGSSLVEAATLPMNGLTAPAALDIAAVAPGQTVAVSGATGAVGGYAVQLAAAQGIRVVATASAGDEDLVLGFGAEFFVPRGDDVAARIREVVPDGVDAVIDAGAVGPSLTSAIRDGGRFAELRTSGVEPVRGIDVALCSCCATTCAAARHWSSSPAWWNRGNSRCAWPPRSRRSGPRRHIPDRGR